MACQHTRLVALDLGNVLIEVRKKRIPNFFFEKPRFDAFTCGKIDSKTFFKEISDSQNIPVAELNRAFSSIVSPYSFARGLLESLRVPFTLWSNINVCHFEHLVKACPSLGQTKYPSSLSFAMKCKKPEPEFFMRSIQHSGIHPGAILYLDDKAENIAAAKLLGIDASLVTQDQDALQILNARSLLKR